MSAVDVKEKERTITIVNAEGAIQGKPMVVVSQAGLSRWLDNIGYITLVYVEDPKRRQLDDYDLLKKKGTYTLGARKQGISPTEQPPSRRRSSRSNMSWQRRASRHPPHAGMDRRHEVQVQF